MTTTTADRALVIGEALIDVVTRSDGVEYRRNVVPDQGLGGRSLDVPIISSAPTGTWRVAAFTDPKRPAIGEATFLVEDYVADRLEFDLTTTATSISPATTAKIEVDGRFLYGAPASGLTLDGEINIAKVTDLPGFAGYVFGLDDDSDADRDDESDTFPLADLPTAIRYAKDRVEDAIKVVVKAKMGAAQKEAAE